MKYRTSKRPPRSLWRRLTRWVRDTVDELTRVEVDPRLPKTLDEWRKR
jgi:hypothetical protein